MENLQIKNPPEFTAEVEKVGTEDFITADLENKIKGALVNNDVFLKKLAEEIRKKSDEHIEDESIHVTSEDKKNWDNKAETSIATQFEDGLMSNEDKGKLDNIADKAEVNQNAISSVRANGTVIHSNSKETQIRISSGSDNVTITGDNAKKEIEISVSGGDADTLGGRDANGIIQQGGKHLAGHGMEGGYSFTGENGGDTGMFSDEDGNLYLMRNANRIELPTSGTIPNEGGTMVYRGIVSDVNVLNNPNFDSSYQCNIPDNTAPQIGLVQDWHHLINLKHWDLNGYNAQIALPYNSTNMRIRQAIGGVWSQWATVITDQMIGFLSKELQLYKYGDVCISVVNGWNTIKNFWKNHGSTEYKDSVQHYIRLNSDHIAMRSHGYNENFALFCDKAIDMTDWTNLNIQYDCYIFQKYTYSNSARIGTCSKLPNKYLMQGDPAVPTCDGYLTGEMELFSLGNADNDKWFLDQVKTMNISALQGYHYIFVTPISWSWPDDYTILHIKRIWLSR